MKKTKKINGLKILGGTLLLSNVIASAKYLATSNSKQQFYWMESYSKQTFFNRPELLFCFWKGFEFQNLNIGNLKRNLRGKV